MIFLHVFDLPRYERKYGDYISVQYFDTNLYIFKFNH